MRFDLLKPHVKDLGAFTVQRLLPAPAHQMVGPFIFFDHMGPALMPPGQGMDVRPHPHIGLATVTWLFEGAGLHRDSLGTVQEIQPGDVNWMIAGRGIVHSERTPAAQLASGGALHGIQTWVALPRANEDDAPSFAHYPAAVLPRIDLPGVSMRLIAGTAFGARSPAQAHTPCFYIEARFAAGATLILPAEHAERAVYLVEGALSIDDADLATSHMAVMTDAEPVRLVARDASTVMLLGGARMDGERVLNWNFVASTRERIDAARADWRGYPNARFGQVPDETEWIPLP